jgi:hypothetical protein
MNELLYELRRAFAPDQLRSAAEIERLLEEGQRDPRVALCILRWQAALAALCKPHKVLLPLHQALKKMHAEGVFQASGGSCVFFTPAGGSCVFFTPPDGLVFS